jgi:hypothetical protein
VCKLLLSKEKTNTDFTCSKYYYFTLQNENCYNDSCYSKFLTFTVISEILLGCINTRCLKSLHVKHINVSIGSYVCRTVMIVSEFQVRDQRQDLHTTFHTNPLLSKKFTKVAADTQIHRQYVCDDNRTTSSLRKE